MARKLLLSPNEIYIVRWALEAKHGAQFFAVVVLSSRVVLVILWMCFFFFFFSVRSLQHKMFLIPHLKQTMMQLGGNDEAVENLSGIKTVQHNH